MNSDHDVFDSDESASYDGLSDISGNSNGSDSPHSTNASTVNDDTATEEYSLHEENEEHEEVGHSRLREFDSESEHSESGAEHSVPEAEQSESDAEDSDIEHDQPIRSRVPHWHEHVLENAQTSDSEDEDFEMNQVENNISNVIRIEDTQVIEPPRIDNQNVIEINDTQILTQANLEDDDDDVIMMPLNIEIIDLCSEAHVPFRNRVNVNEVIEIEDSPAPRRLRSSRGGNANPQPDRALTRTSPYQRKNAQTGSSSKAVPKMLDLSDTQDTQTGGIQGSCPICFESYLRKRDHMMSTKCGHVFCKTCIQAAIRESKKCPVCRKGLTGKDAIHPLFFSGQ